MTPHGLSPQQQAVFEAYKAYFQGKERKPAPPPTEIVPMPEPCAEEGQDKQKEETQ